jgi:hypothetical protein
MTPPDERLNELADEAILVEIVDARRQITPFRLDQDYCRSGPNFFEPH